MAARLSAGRYQRQGHLDHLSDVLADAALTGDRRVIVSMPPRHGKSTTASLHFPVWFLSLFPERHVVLASYERNYAASWGRKVRDTIRRYGASLGGLRIRQDVSAAGEWELERHGGGMYCTGTAAGATGRGADVLLIDDPVKNWVDAYSEKRRAEIWNWYLSVAETRLEPGASVALIMTRWHQDDLAGRLLREQPDQWTEIRFPALATEGDVLGRAEGDALWSGRYGAERLRGIERRLGPQVFGALFQQDPAPAGNRDLPRDAVRHYTATSLPPPASMDRIVQSWDMAFKAKADTDFVVGQLWGFKGADAYLLDQARGRWSFAITCQEWLRLQRSSPLWRRASAKLVEDKANGPAVVSALRQAIPGLIEVSPQGSKEARVAACSPLWLAGNVHVPDPSVVPWAAGFVEECHAFPTAPNDDQVDAMTQALIQVYLLGTLGPTDLDPTLAEALGIIDPLESVRGGRARR